MLLPASGANSYKIASIQLINRRRLHHRHRHLHRLRKKALRPCLFFSTPISQMQRRKHDMILISDVQTNLSLFII